MDGMIVPATTSPAWALGLQFGANIRAREGLDEARTMQPSVKATRAAERRFQAHESLREELERQLEDVPLGSMADAVPVLVRVLGMLGETDWRADALKQAERLLTRVILHLCAQTGAAPQDFGADFYSVDIAKRAGRH